MPGYSYGVELRLRRRNPLLLRARAGLRPDLQSAHHDPAGRADAGRIPPAPDQRLLPDPRLRHLPARPRRLRRPAGRPRVPRRRRDQGPVRAQRQMGVGLGRRVAVGLLLHVRLPPRAVQGSAGLVPEPADGSDLAALSDRRRQSQLLRRAHDLLSQLLRQPGQGAGDSSGHRLQQRDQQPDLGRRVQLQDELHQPVARHRRVRPDHDGGQYHRPVHERLRRSAGADTVAMPAARHARHLHPPDRGSAMAALVHRPDRPDLDAVRDRCAPMRSTPRSRTSRAFPISCRSATPRRCG